MLSVTISEPFMASSGNRNYRHDHLSNDWVDRPPLVERRAVPPQIPPYQLHAGKAEDKVVIELIPVNFKPLV